MTIEIRPEILAFAEKMEQEMRENDPEKGDSWKTCEIEFLESKLDEEWYEWFESGNLDELIDFSIVAMMVWHRKHGENRMRHCPNCGKEIELYIPELRGCVHCGYDFWDKKVYNRE